MAIHSLSARGWGLFLLVLCGSLLIACTGSPAPVPTAPPATWAPAPTPTLRPVPTRKPTLPPTATPHPTVPTRTSIPTLTPIPTLAPTNTPYPTHTPLPTLALPAAAVVPTGWPALPADLYFLRDGALWRWPAAGGPPQQIAAGTVDDPLVDYRLAPGEQKVAYLTASYQLSVLDRATGEQIPIATMENPRGDDHINVFYRRLNPDPDFTFTPDGRYLVYLDRQAGQARAVDLLAPDTPYDLGTCQYQRWDAWPIDCLGPVLSPDGRQVAFQDGYGLWISQVPDGQPRLLLEHEVIRDPDRNCCVYLPLSWSPDGRWLLIEVGAYEGTDRAVLDVLSGELQELPNTGSYLHDHVEVAWNEGGVWVSHVWWSGRKEGRSFLYQAQLSAGAPPQVTYWISQTEFLGIAPVSLHSLPGGRLALAHQWLADNPASPESAVYFREADGTMRLAVPLPALRYDDPVYYQGIISWTADASAFLYLSMEPDHGDILLNPALLGRTNGAALWDVRELLQGATLFRWVSP